MRALELDPQHFHKVEQEPVHHERSYWSEAHAVDTQSGKSGDHYYEQLIGYEGEKYGDHHYEENAKGDIDFSSEEDDLNDIQFSINEDVQFKLSTSDNYEGRDIDVGIVMPDDSGTYQP